MFCNHFCKLAQDCPYIGTALPLSRKSISVILGTVKNLYEEGIRISFEENDISEGLSTYLANTNKVSNYVDPLKGQNGQSYDYSAPLNTNVTVAWQDGDFEQSLERIITQKWIANFPNGMEAWSEYRRTGYPKLMLMAANESKGVVDDQEGARRMPYPANDTVRIKNMWKLLLLYWAKSLTRKKVIPWPHTYGGIVNNWI